MKRIYSALALLTTLSLPNFASAQTLRDDLAARYREFNRAMQRRDMQFLNTYLSPTFTVDLPTGEKRGKDDAIKGFSDLRNAVRSLNWTFKLFNESVGASGVTVIADGHLVADAIGPDKKKHRLDLKGQTEDRWVLLGNVWMLDHVRFLKLQGTIDGKPAPIPGIQ